MIAVEVRRDRHQNFLFSEFLIIGTKPVYMAMLCSDFLRSHAIESTGASRSPGTNPGAAPFIPSHMQMLMLEDEVRVL